MDAAFLTTRLDRPSHRFRSAQFFPEFTQRGHRCTEFALPKSRFLRWRLFRQLSAFDAVCLQQRLLSRVEFGVLRRSVDCLIYDVDDAVMFDPRGVRAGRRAARFERTVRGVDLVICGNHYLLDQLPAGHPPACVLPTAVDTRRFRPRADGGSKHTFVVGWTGSRGTNRYLNRVLPILAELPPPAEVRIISDTLDGLQLDCLRDVPWRFEPWSAESEVEHTSEFDVGLMPLPDDVWTRGKCGCKALQYMALGIPAVCSPVGVNCDIIQHGQTGYLPKTDEDWLHGLRHLMCHPDEAAQVGAAGRCVAEQRYCVRHVGRQLVELFERAVTAKERPCAASAAS